MFDVIFISYDEPNADENWERLLDQVPYAIRVHGIKGIPNAHIEAARQVTTSHFFCVDADNIVDDSFDFEKVVDFQTNDRRVHVWGCKNVVNGLQYGYGGVKLFPTDHVEHIKEYSVDFCTSAAAASGGFKVHRNIASTTYFNTSPFNAWKSGFRECTKLSSAIIDKQKNDETVARLKIWTSVGLDVEYGEYAIAGARMGADYGVNNNGTTQQEIDNLNAINDFEFCKKKFIEEDVENDVMFVLETYGGDATYFSAEHSALIKSVLYKL